MEDLASKTDGLSGADLQALVYNAHLDVVHSSISTNTQVNGDIGKDKIKEKEKEKGRKYRQLVPPEGEVSSAERSAMDTRVSSTSLCVTSKLMIRCRPSWIINHQNSLSKARNTIS